METLGAIAAIFTAIGFGGVLGAFVQHRFQERRELGAQEHELRQRRYLCILMIMLAKLDPDAGLSKLPLYRPDLTSMDSVDEELRTEILNAIVFAGHDVLRSLVAFVKEPTYAQFAESASAMRHDLWGRKHRMPDDLVHSLITLSKTPAANPRASVGTTA